MSQSIKLKIVSILTLNARQKCFDDRRICGFCTFNDILTHLNDTTKKPKITSI